ncbi:serine protease 30 [Drosophila elegans]|uniref:serine protease 30 n=1 Tax=Drosophila elegans TaxID=30023 RepID=UPI0007E84EC8|nr:serine protease 30 [Drosophila elegans]
MVFQFFIASREMQTFLVCSSLFIFFLPCLLGASSFLEEPCGRAIIPKVIRGYNAGQEYAAWMAAIRNDTNFLCGGTLIHKRFILTAAHCIDGQSSLFVSLGAYNKSNPIAEYDVSVAVIHRSYNRFTHLNDIGLLKLSTSVVYNVFVHPICIILDMRIKSQVEATQTFKAFGWGEKSDGQESEILQTITLNHLARAVCTRHLGVSLISKQICAGANGGDTCRGDSGGPLTSTITVGERLRESQFGIVSYGKTSCNAPGVYTDVTSYADWIEATIKTHNVGNGLQKSVSHRSDLVQDTWVYEDCGGATIASNLEANILGFNFQSKGVLITDRFVITNARRLPENAPLVVGVMGMWRSYGEYRVDAVFKHPKYSEGRNDIALLRLNRSVTHTDGMKPICMLVNAQHQQLVESSPFFTVFDYVETEVPKQIYAVSVTLIQPVDCSYRIHRTIYRDQLCLKHPRGMSQNYGKPGDLLGGNIMLAGKKRFVLLGIVSYSSNGVHVLTNVMRHSEWIKNMVKSN